MPNKWYFLILLLLCRCLNGTGFSEWKCEEDKKAVLVYVKNQNQFIAHNISTGDTQILNPKFKTMGIVTDFVLDNAFGRSYYFGFLDDKRLNRVTDVQIEEEKIKKIKHSEIRDSVKEFEATRFHSYIYVITKENEIKLCCNPKMILVHSQPDTEYTNLILDDKRGRMFWIEEKSSNCAIKLAGMDGKNVREVYSNNKIYSFTHDNDLNQLHIALEDSIDVIDVNSKERKFQLNVKASRLYYYNCALYFDNRNSRKISVYSNEHKIKELVNDADVNSPFAVMYKVTRNYLANPCNNIFCAEYCVFGESEQGPIPICIDPDADENSDEFNCKKM
ncbi:hypothetical protein M3Y97_00923000 [Aphelenchoides bicaudatus]|nr:hypothetical protein M3Y97_00923000 [Aphelenchoides bicaudatus]